MHFGLDDPSRERLDLLILAINRNTAAIEAANALEDAKQNGPRG